MSRNASRWWAWCLRRTCRAVFGREGIPLIRRLRLTGNNAQPEQDMSGNWQRIFHSAFYDLAASWGTHRTAVLFALVKHGRKQFGREVAVSQLRAGGGMANVRRRVTYDAVGLAYAY